MKPLQQSVTDWVAFLQRPTFSLVLSALLLVTGLIAWQQLPLRRYPAVEVPRINIYAAYPNASPNLVERDITLPLESVLAKIPGIESLQARSHYGHSSLKVHFRPGVEFKEALAQVQREMATARLPKGAQPPMVYLPEGGTRQFLMFLAVDHPHLSPVELTHQMRLHGISLLRAVPGVAGLNLGGDSYTMRVWLNRAKMAARGVGANQVIAALRDYQTSLPAGELHGAPITIDRTLQRPEDFAAVPLSRKGQSVITLGDVAHVELTGQSQERRRRLNGKTAVISDFSAASDGNLIAASDAIRAALFKLRRRLPSGSSVTVLADAAQSVRESLRGVRQAIGESVVLVALILFAFLRRFGITLVPVVVIPLSLVATAALLKLFGCSLNVLSLLGLALAVGIVVDDAIVVVENIHRHVQAGLSPRQAALKSGRELGFAIVGITLTLVSVYAPIALVPDLMGQVFGEFALALAGSVVISGVLALTLSPMMATRLLRSSKSHVEKLAADGEKAGNLEQRYANLLTLFLPRKGLALMLVVTLTAMVGISGWLLPAETVPHEDAGFLVARVSRIGDQPISKFDNQVLKPIERAFAQVSEVKDVLVQAGDWGGFFFAVLKPRAQRSRSDQAAEKDVQRALDKIPGVDAHVYSYSPSLPGMASGDQGETATLIVKTTRPYAQLHQQLKTLVTKLDAESCVGSVSQDLNQNQKGFSVKLDTHRMTQLGIQPRQVAQVIQTFFHQDASLSWYKDSVEYKATVALRQPSRYLEEIDVTTQESRLVPLAAVATLRETTLPQGGLPRQDRMRAARVSIRKMDSCSVQETVATTERIARDLLSDDFTVEWDESTKRVRAAFWTMWLLFALAVLFIYGSLAVLFNNFLDPLVILFTVPLACGGALGLMWGLGMKLSIFSYLGLITLVGLITKHGILLVEFSGQLLQQGLDPLQAARQAAKQRFRPIVMTALSTAVGHAPLLWATGAGAAARQAIGVVLVGGMVTGTVLTLLVIPTLWAWAWARTLSSSSS